MEFLHSKVIISGVFCKCDTMYDGFKKCLECAYFDMVGSTVWKGDSSVMEPGHPAQR